MFSNPADPKQWDGDALQIRKGRPCLTFDRTNQFIAQVVNQARQNKPSIKVHPVDDNGDTETAAVIDGLIRNIEYTSHADIAYDTAAEHMVEGGRGWVYLRCDYVHDRSEELEIFIKRVRNPFTVYLDPGTYYFWRAKAGWTFTNPDTEVVA